MHKRYVATQVQAAMQDTPVVMIAGPRQCRKTTLAKQLINPDWAYITFDDLTQLQSARHDPMGFIMGLLKQRLVLDKE